MHTKVVYRAGEALNDLGFRVLRFNFRGVGRSTGTYDEGVGEQDDVRAALDWLALGVRDRPIVAGGASFGSMMSFSVGAEDPRVRALVGVGTPVRVYDYGYLSRTTKPVLVVQGEHDEFGPAREAAEILEALGEHITVVEVPGAGHLFDGHFDELKEAIRDYFTQGPGAVILADAEVPEEDVGTAAEAGTEADAGTDGGAGTEADAAGADPGREDGKRDRRGGPT